MEKEEILEDNGKSPNALKESGLIDPIGIKPFTSIPNARTYRKKIIKRKMRQMSQSSSGRKRGRKGRNDGSETETDKYVENYQNHDNIMDDEEEEDTENGNAKEQENAIDKNDTINTDNL
ncbi:hypothetical protein CHS0354_033844 [Potamilus streckersoni]|uniref:Uncharacterized protein n=1 Tax=Potamilus streckersoni TaxID=2493646 RepID=A0AAE0T8S7_9BIVA|nr:hypothetical protein CHS0354_033844 [Potamilus streckersoni]